MSKRTASPFWISYSDFMTSLFFVMLALYAVTFHLLNKSKKVAVDKAEQLDKIKAIENSIKDLDSTHFVYQKAYKRFILKDQIEFSVGDYRIRSRYKPELRTVGKEILDLVNRNKSNEKVRYLVIIEGMASLDKYEDNYPLSYKRALALYELWTLEQQIVFDTSFTEVLISGSGTGGVGRSHVERENQRFLVQIIPKIQLD